MNANYEHLVETEYDAVTVEEDVKEFMADTISMNQNVPRSTLVEQFSVKIRALEEHNRDGLFGRDVMKILKYFQQKLLEWAKDNLPGYNTKTKEFNHLDYPAVDYTSLYKILLRSLKVSKRVKSDVVEEYVDSVLRCIACLVPFLPARALSAMPARISSLLGDLPSFTQSKAIDLICLYLIPLTFGIILKDSDKKKSPVGLSAPSILLSVLQSCADRSLCFKVIESLMRFRENVCSDLLSVLAYGSTEAVEPAIHLLNRYFPAVGAGGVNIGVAEFRAAPADSASAMHHHIRCQSTFCPGKDVYSAVKVCLDPGLCSYALNRPPPIYLCKSCHADKEKHREGSKENHELFLDVIQYLTLISEYCENPYCQSEQKMAIYFCFSTDCTKKNKNKPMRICENCHLCLHSAEKHMVHSSLSDLWTLENPMQTYLIDVIGRLLREAQPLHKERCILMGMDPDTVASLDIQDIKNTQFYEKIMRSLHGVWLIIFLCKVPTSYIYEHVSRLLSMLFSWVEAVSCMKHSYPQLVTIVERCLDLAKAWMLQLVQYDFNLYCDCLLPMPPVQARVGLAWDALMSNMRQQLEGFQRLSVLVTRDFIPDQVWERIMPYWMQELKSNVSTDELSNFNVILGRLFDVRHDTTPSYSLNFITKRLHNVSHGDKQEALVWLQILSAIGICLEIENLLSIFIVSLGCDDIEHVKSETATVFHFPTADVYQEIPESPIPMSPICSTPTLPLIFPAISSVEDTLTFCILMIDILTKQFFMQIKQMKKELTEMESTYLKDLLIIMLDKDWHGEHSDHVTRKCNHCQRLAVFYYQVSSLIDFVLPKEMDDEQLIDQGLSKSPGSTRGSRASKSSEGSTSHSSSIRDSCSKEFAQKKMSEQSEYSAKESASRKSSAISGTDFDDDASFSGFVSSSGLIQGLDETDGSITGKVSVGGDSVNSEGSDPESLTEWKDRIRSNASEKYIPKFLGALQSGWQPIFNAYPDVKLTVSLLEEVLKQKDPTILQHILTSLNILCIRGECLRIAVREDLDFAYQLQTMFFIPSLWEILESSNSQLAQLAVPLLLYCVCLPYGAERLCDEIEIMFNNENWKKRFSAVEKVTLLCQFLSTESIRDSSLAKSTLVHGFAYLVSAVEDVHNAVSNRARMMLKSIRTSSLNCLYTYMEDHFRREPGDRMMLLNTFRSLNYLLEGTSPFSGQFFMKLFNYMMIQNIRLPDFGTTTQRSRTDSMMSMADSVFQGPNIPLWSRAQSSPGRMSGVYTNGRSTLGSERPRSYSAPLVRYKEMYTLKFRRHSSYTLGRNDAVDEVFEGPSALGPRKRRVWTPGCDPSMMRNIEDRTMLGGAGGFILGSVQEENSGSEEGSIKRSSVVSTMSAASDPSVIYQDMDSEVLHSLVTIFLEYLANGSKTNQTAVKRQDILMLEGFIAELMGVKENELMLKPEELRQSTVFLAYMFNITQVLDQNPTIGKEFMKLTLQLMLYCLFENGDNWNEEFIKTSLANLSGPLQHAWLMNLLIIFYKLPFREYDEIVQMIVIVINTLNAHSHNCDRGPGLRRAFTWKRSQSGKTAGGRKYRTITKALFRFDNGKEGKKVGKGGTALTASMKDDNGFGAAENLELTNLSSSVSNSVGKKEVTKSNRMGHPAPSAETKSQSDGASTKISESTSAGIRIITCEKCQLPLTQFGEEILNECIVVLSTFIHRDPELAAPLLMDILLAVGRKANPSSFPWESKGSVTVPGATVGIAKQFLRCVFVQLNPNGVFVELFRSDIFDKDFFRAVTCALRDFPHMEETVPLEKVLQDFSSRTNRNDRIVLLLRNINVYLECISKDHLLALENLLQYFESFFKYLTSALPTGVDLSVCFEIMSEVLGMQKNFCKTLLPNFGQILSHVIKKCDFKLGTLRKLCHICNRAFSKERDRVYLTRTVLQEMALILKCKSSTSERCLKKLIQFILLDADSWFSFGAKFDLTAKHDLAKKGQANKLRTHAMKCLQVYNSESVEFIKSWNYRLKDAKDKENEDDDDFPILVKAGMAQALALQLRPEQSKIAAKVLGWIQIEHADRRHTDKADQILEIASNLRLLTWIILGALNHMAELPMKRKELIHCIPLSESLHIAENVELILSLNFRISENDKVRRRMIIPSIYFALIFSQAWTIYCEHHISTRSFAPTEAHPLSIIMEFWARITAVILRILKESKQLEREVIWIFAGVIEELAKHSKQAYARLSPLWFPLLGLYKTEIKDVYDRLLKLETGEEDNNMDSMEHLREWILKSRVRLAYAEKAGNKFKLESIFEV